MYLFSSVFPTKDEVFSSNPHNFLFANIGKSIPLPNMPVILPLYLVSIFQNREFLTEHLKRLKV